MDAADAPPHHAADSDTGTLDLPGPTSPPMDAADAPPAATDDFPCIGSFGSLDELDSSFSSIGSFDVLESLVTELFDEDCILPDLSEVQPGAAAALLFAHA